MARLKFFSFSFSAKWFKLINAFQNSFAPFSRRQNGGSASDQTEKDTMQRSVD
jgi:hypothetical protein